LKWNGSYLKLKSIILKYYWVAVIPLAILGFFAAVVEDHEIKKHPATTYGTVYFTRPVYKKPSKRYYDYEFVYKGTVYRGSSMEYLSENIDNGKIYKVEFSDQNPKHNRMVFDMEYSMQLKPNGAGMFDTTYIPTEQLKRGIPAYLKDRMDSLKIEN